MNVKFRYSDDADNGQYSVTTLVIIISICSVICIVITIVVAVAWHHKKAKSKTLNISKTSQRSDKYMPVNGFSTTGVWPQDNLVHFVELKSCYVLHTIQWLRTILVLQWKVFTILNFFRGSKNMVAQSRLRNGISSAGERSWRNLQIVIAGKSNKIHFYLNENIC